MLPESALAVLQRYRERMPTAPHGPEWYSRKPILEVFEAEALLDGHAYAKWAAERLVDMLRRNNQDAGANLVVAKAWAVRILRRRYLVQAEFVNEAYQHALVLAEKR